jgi:hypothetical protein
MEIISEQARNCKLVKLRSVESGHDCWGKLEFSKEFYITMEGKEKRVFLSGM